MTLTQRHPNAAQVVARAIERGLMAPADGTVYALRDRHAAYMRRWRKNWKTTVENGMGKISPHTPLTETIDADADADAGVNFVKRCQ